MLRRLAIGELLVWMPLGPLAATGCGLSGASRRWASVQFLPDADPGRELWLGVAGCDFGEVTGGADAVGLPVTGRGADIDLVRSRFTSSPTCWLPDRSGCFGRCGLVAGRCISCSDGGSMVCLVTWAAARVVGAAVLVG
ncbi:hypothetical protein VPH35_138634 [Triticum aestivum]